MKIRGKYFFEDIREQYNINDLESEEGYVYCKIKKGCYGLKQAEKLAREQLVEHLAQYGYAPDPYAPNIWGHETRPTKFCLCVDDFGIKSFSDEDTKHLLGALKDKYNISIDTEGCEYYGLHLNWNYKQGWVDVSMPQYVDKTLGKLNHKPPLKPEHAPHIW